MDKKKLLALISKKEARKAELGTKANATEDVKELRSINTELELLNTEIAELRSLVDSIPDPEETEDTEEENLEARSASLPKGNVNVMGTYGFGKSTSNGSEKREEDLKVKLEKRGQDLKDKKTVTFEMNEVPELRAVSIGGGTLVVPTKYSDTLNGTFNQVSGIIDNVNAVELNGGNSYEKGFEVSFGEGDYSTETGNYTETDPTVDYVTIGKSKVTAYSEMTDESTKLPNVNYQELVRRNITVALRKKMTKQIMIGPGGANAMTGIFNAPANVIPTASDIEVSEIDADTLDNIVFGYGGDEDIEGGATLILSKSDLAAFAAIRSSDGKKLYKIKKNGNTGTISSDESFEVPFIINSACPALSADATGADTYCMAYGYLKNYEMAIFSPVQVEESRDYKFRTGQIAYRGVVWAGGSVASYKGFARVKKVAAT